MLIATVALLSLVGSIGAVRLYARRRRQSIKRYYVARIVSGDTSTERYITSVDSIRGGRVQQCVAEVIAGLSSAIYRVDESPLLELSRSLHIEEYLLAQASRSDHHSRVGALMLLSQIPLEHNLEGELSKYSHDGDRMVRFMALMATIHSDSRHFVQHIASYPDVFTPFEVSYIVALVSRGDVAIAYPPLLHCSSPNLNSVGLALVRCFGVDSAADSVASLALRSPWRHVRSQAIDLLVAMQFPVLLSVVSRHLSGLPRSERYSLLRHIAMSGYSEHALKGVVNSDENRYYHSLVNSYKIKIEC